MYTEIHVDISHFNEHTKQSSATYQNRKKPTKYLVSLLVALTFV